MQKKLIIVLFVFGFLSIFTGLGISFIYDLKEDRAATLLRMEDVKTEYKNFGDQIDVFNDIRNSLYMNFLENVYYDTMAATDAEVKKAFTSYEVSVNSIGDASNKLSSLCGDIYFFDDNINDKCNSFANVYEQIVNAFVSDVEFYNNNISQYNSYQAENGATSVLENYQTDKKYIDYNKDKKFEGKDE